MKFKKKKKTEFEKRFSAIRSTHPIQYIRCCELIKYTCAQLIFKLDFYESEALDKKNLILFFLPLIFIRLEPIFYPLIFILLYLFQQFK